MILLVIIKKKIKFKNVLNLQVEKDKKACHNLKQMHRRAFNAA